MPTNAFGVPGGLGSQGVRIKTLLVSASPLTCQSFGVENVPCIFEFVALNCNSCIFPFCVPQIHKAPIPPANPKDPSASKGKDIFRTVLCSVPTACPHDGHEENPRGGFGATSNARQFGQNKDKEFSIRLRCGRL